MDEDNNSLQDKRIRELNNKLQKEGQRSTDAEAINALSQTGNTSGEKEQPTKQELRASPDAVVQPLRTLERDIANVVRNKNASVVSINIEEQKRKEELRKKEVTNPDLVTNRVQKSPTYSGEKFARKGILFLVSVVIIVGAAGIFAATYFVQRQQDPVVVEAPRKTVIGTEHEQIIELENITKTNIEDELIERMTDPAPNGSLTGFIIREDGESISSNKFFETVAVSAPGDFVRALNPLWLVGMHSKEYNQPFIITKVDSFDNAFSGMLSWERTIKNDLKNIFSSLDSQTVGTTTVPVVLKAEFEDMIIKNKDTRVLKNNYGEIKLMYSFLDNNTLLITSNEETFLEILNRFFSSNLTR